MAWRELTVDLESIALTLDLVAAGTYPLWPLDPGSIDPDSLFIVPALRLHLWLRRHRMATGHPSVRERCGCHGQRQSFDSNARHLRDPHWELVSAAYAARVEVAGIRRCRDLPVVEPITHEGRPSRAMKFVEEFPKPGGGGKRR
jgi:hypothetical protein